MTDQGGDLEETVHLQDTNHVEDGAARRRVIQQREYVDVEAGRARIVLEYFLGVLDLLTERIEVARAQIDEHIDDVEGESEEIQGGVERVEAGRIDRDTHRNEHYRVDGDKDDQVGPAYTPDVFTWDDVLACSSTFNLLLQLFLLELLLQVARHEHDGGHVHIRPLFQNFLITHILKLLVLLYRYLLQ